MGCGQTLPTLYSNVCRHWAVHIVLWMRDETALISLSCYNDQGSDSVDWFCEMLEELSTTRSAWDLDKLRCELLITAMISAQSIGQGFK